ncbi:Uncharacterized protein TCM_020489 [Theobroma cacao]|uniref:Uncharacterized protein n=1 Tax=Theobroma cacao TaxID=3641 RepID=A0A061ELD8_THECC|nr:Uncharacterized protein TCM_020489 [Theobroma cacao]
MLRGGPLRHGGGMPVKSMASLWSVIVFGTREACEAKVSSGENVGEAFPSPGKGMTALGYNEGWNWLAGFGEFCAIG